MNDIFSYKSAAGNTVNLPKVSEGYIRFYVQNSNNEECRAYCQRLVLCGFEIKQERIISAGSRAKYKNASYILEKGETQVFLFYDSSLHTAFVSITPKTALASGDGVCCKTFDEGEMTFTQLALLRGGMSYAAKFRDGSFIIIDGGLSDSTDEENLYKFLKENSRGKPHVRMWMITHPHLDHIELPTSFIKRYGTEFELDEIGYNFYTCSEESIPHDGAEGRALAEVFIKTVKEYFPSARMLELHAGEELFFSGASLEVLLCPDNSFPQLNFSCNDISIITRLKFDTGKTVMLLADASNHLSRQLARTYGDYLKSDVLQLAHHGLIGGDVELYKLIDPDVCLWPVKDERFRGVLQGQTYQYCIGEGGLDYNEWIRDESIKRREHYSNLKNVSIKA